METLRGLPRSTHSCVKSAFRVPTLNRWPVVLSTGSPLVPVLRIYVHFMFNLQNLKGGETGALQMKKCRLSQMSSLS